MIENNKYTNLKNLLILFANICEKHNIWYSLDKKTLLSAISGFDYWEKDGYFEVLMAYDGYQKLIQVALEHCLDDTTNNAYQTPFPKFVYQKEKFWDENVFIKINILVNTTQKKVKQFSKLPHQTRINITKNRNLKKCYSFKTCFFRFIDLMSFKKTVLTFFKLEYAMLLNKRFDGSFNYNENSKDYKKNWFNVFDYKSQKITWWKHEFLVMSNYDAYLKKNYGSNYMQYIRFENKYVYIDPVNQVAINKKSNN